MRITLIHALTHSMPPIVAAFGRLWPEAWLVNLLDDSLSTDLAREGALTAVMTDRFLTPARYSARTGANAILLTCSASGLYIDACVRELAPMPVLKPNEAMMEQAVALTGPSGRVGLVATFAPMLASMPAEFTAVAPGVTVVPCLATGALPALDRGDVDGHDRAAAQAAATVKDCDVIGLGQFSLARAAQAVAEASARPC